ncbi:hypothetical protein EYF80_013536 [Liparis tanakae]|uniref:Secreted protein n=1 Tax=Liparis tanakae TaxID=230148 RepID=A0A4Z2IE10_9TELE|nr:hypothetical protein EYF80_013536 [Liparis tanakae]
MCCLILSCSWLPVYPTYAHVIELSWAGEEQEACSAKVQKPPCGLQTSRQALKLALNGCQLTLTHQENILRGQKPGCITCQRPAGTTPMTGGVRGEVDYYSAIVPSRNNV